MFGVKYPDGSYSGPITHSRALATSYASRYGAAVYEVGSAADPAPRRQRQAAPWFPDDVAAAEADVYNNLEKCYGAKFGSG